MCGCVVSWRRAASSPQGAHPVCSPDPELSSLQCLIVVVLFLARLKLLHVCVCVCVMFVASAGFSVSIYPLCIHVL